MKRAVLLLTVVCALALPSSAGAYVYWSNNGGSASMIGRAALNGSGADQSFIDGATSPYGVAVDASHLYWTNGGGTNSIGRADVDGGNADQDFITGAGSPVGVAVDGSHVYWTNDATNAIGRANLDGSSPDQAFIAGLDSAEGLSLIHI